MTRKETEHNIEELVRLKRENPQSAFEFAQKLILACKKYLDIMPQILLYRADICLRLGRYEGLNEQYLECIDLATKSDNKRIVALALIGQGVAILYEHDAAASKELFEQTLSLAIMIGDKEAEGKALANLALVYHQWGLRELAVGYAKDAYEAMKGTNDITLPLYRLAVLSSVAGDYERAISYITEGLEFLHSHNYKYGRAPFYSELGSIYSRMEQFDKAKEHYESSLREAEIAGDIENAMTSMILLAANEIRLGNYDTADTALHTALAMSDGNFRTQPEVWCQYYFAFNAFYRGDPNEAIRILDEKLAGVPIAFGMQLTEGIYSLYGEAYSQTGSWENATLYERKLREYREQVNSTQFKSNLTTAQALIATEREKHDKELEKMKREQLERELSNTTLQLLAQTEALAEFREGILAVVRKAPPTEPIARELREKLKVLPCKSIDWDLFETQFKAAHPEFRLKLLELYPDLTKMELRICTLIRMNLKSDDISRLTCLSERNIENHRYRIRKKLNMVKEQDLAQELAKM